MTNENCRDGMSRQLLEVIVVPNACVLCGFGILDGLRNRVGVAGQRFPRDERHPDLTIRSDIGQWGEERFCLEIAAVAFARGEERRPRLIRQRLDQEPRSGIESGEDDDAVRIRFGLTVSGRLLPVEREGKVRWFCPFDRRTCRGCQIQGIRRGPARGAPA